ncbi:S8 family serine peptidase [Sphingomonas canadensis]|uniref:S8 family serine peptidase n=1 Tax=Sphingomonas canadensis TaxID=1219257 RepID=A0ABW3H2P2_9SPHN|nr:S8 family serine peptidase [Sphingomonas canadensis]MCW3834452.1 S8 family serine peptidase [Sphingomonas canadensis]
MRTLALLFMLGLIAAPPTAGQVVPPLPPLPGVEAPLAPVRPLVDGVLETPSRVARKLADLRIDRLKALVRANRDAIVLDPDGNPARAGEIIVADPNPALIDRAIAGGFRLIEQEIALGVGFARFAVPHGVSLRAAIRTLRKLGARDVLADQLYFQGGQSGLAMVPLPMAFPAAASATVGMIDGGVLGNGVEQRGFAAGAPRASDHGTAVASLIAGSGPIRGGAPRARVLAADVYGSDPAGGSATAIAKALAWLVGRGVPVVTISLVGPANPLLGRVIAAAQDRGVIIVAAVGNDGPAAPYAYPASYPLVIAVTGVDASNRILIEAGRALHLDYAAPGADMAAANARGGTSSVRGTSFAAPLVAARIASFYPRPDPRQRGVALARVDGEAQRLGRRYGRGLVCGGCRTSAR